MPRACVPHVNLADIEPTSRGPGRFSYMLSRDPDTTARTAVQKVLPTPDFQSEPMAHYHHTTEEILVLEGLLSFDSRAWLSPGSYVFHPSETVHGFASCLPVACTYISRTGADLDFNYVPEPLRDTPYPVGEAIATRALVSAPGAVSGAWETLPATGESHFPVWLQVLSLDTRTGEGSAMIRLSAGNRLFGAAFAYERELFVLEGAMLAQAGQAFTQYSYACWVSGDAQPSFESEFGVLLYLYCQRDLTGTLAAMGLRRDVMAAPGAV